MKSDTHKIANVPRFDWSRRFDPAYAREYGEAYRAVVGIPPMLCGDDDEPLSKEEADKIKKAIAEKDKELRAATKENGKLESKVEALTETVEELTEKVSKGGDGGDGGGADDKRISKLEERVEKAEAKAEAAEEKREAAEQQSTAIDVATRLRFRNPKRAIKQLDPDDLTDEDSIESALEQLATEEPYMVSTKKQRTVDDKPKPKSKPKGDKKPKGGDDEEGSKTGDDEPVGKDRIRAAYGESEGGDGEGDEGGDEGGSED